MNNTELRLKNANSSIIELISGEQAIEKIQRPDDFTNNFSSFDLYSRLNSPTATTDDYLKFVAQQILPWNDATIQSITSCVDSINTDCINKLQLLIYPPRIFLIMTNGKDENDAAYCRNQDLIILPRNMILSGQVYKILIHELFHIWSKWHTNSIIRDELYTSIGFHKIPIENSIEFPISLNELKMTNPDAPIPMKYYINLKKIDDKNEKIYKCTPILHASRPFNPKVSTNFFYYLTATTLILDDITYQPLEPLEYLSYKEASNFYDQIGNNTGYIIHPEEILADNFVLWMTKGDDLTNLNTPDIINKMDDIISNMPLTT
ncbi:unnamed protein product [Adineta steineri]|uniref:Uncharacterized protein n=1 Tax=Adineta steineri TaxID=433720 RepID=A0A813SD87_9BILA|nr:unnamed protein product [Adineta steineri]CAF1279393.1 unnamed protein product [Adineta steineri]CAF3606333.1 unnamed protein product [Adineta steineri]CAF3720062.1 unnamed protein product [Adineta steineri]CAF3740208.1 unnamed protein product [Adineta steineri]